MDTVNTHEAKTNLSKLLARVAKGEQIVIAKDGKPIARLIPEPTLKKRDWGRDRDTVWIADDFDAPLPDLEKLYR